MTVKEILAQLKALGDEARRKHNAKAGAPDNQFGVKLGDVRAMAKNIKTDHKLALKLWDTGNVDAQVVAIGEKIGLYRDWSASKGCTPSMCRCGWTSW
jgi:3-methyladenine DNA glycosylase AlkD